MNTNPWFAELLTSHATLSFLTCLHCLVKLARGEHFCIVDFFILENAIFEERNYLVFCL